MVADAAVAPKHTMVRDPVLLLPLVVAAGLAVGWLGVQRNVSGARVAVDLALAWSLVAAGVIANERPRWRREAGLLAAAGFAVLAADLEWSGSHVPWTIGLLLAGLWVALLVHVVLTFPDGRPWSRAAGPAIVGAYSVAIGGQFVAALTGSDSRDVLAVAPQPTVADAADRVQEVAALLLAVFVLALVLGRTRALARPARGVQGPLLVAAALAISAALVWLIAVIVGDAGKTTLETTTRAVAIALPVAVVAGMLWSRLGPAVAPDLVVELQTQPPATLRTSLAEALGDTTLEVGYRLADGRYVDAAGRQIEVAPSPDRAVTPLVARGAEIGVLVHDPALLDEPALVDSVRAAAGLVIENERLAAAVRSQLAEVRDSRGRIVAAADDERRRIERDLHDGAQQRLVTLSVSLGLEASRADEPTADVLVRAQDEVEQAIADLRELARGIHPTLLRDEGLGSAVQALARRAPLPVAVECTVRDRLPEHVELAAYFVVSEALTNVVKHASANEASVRLEHASASLLVAISDDGLGGARVVPGSGLAGLRDRLDALDAELVVESARQGGTTIRAELPCAW